MSSRTWALLICVLALANLPTHLQAAHVLHEIEGRVIWPEDVTSPSKMKLVLTLESGNKLYGWPRGDGSFVLHDVPEGMHLLDVIAIGLTYPQIRMDVNGAYHSKAQASLADQPSRILPSPVLIKPISLAEYFEKREPFNIIGFLKTPYGMMAAFGIFAVFILPKMKIDPEELQEATAAIRGESTPAAVEPAPRPNRRRD